MSNRTDIGVVAITAGLILILLAVVGGAGVYYLVGRQQMMFAETAQRAQVAEAQARLEAEQARAEAASLIAAQTPRQDDETSNAPDDAIRAAVEAVLLTQQDAWNRGDVDAFMEHYWKSDELTFSSGGRTTRGWQATLDSYRERYPTPEEMGRLSFSGLEITPVGDSAALVLGEWKLDRESEPVGGNFSIVFRKIDNQWVIVHDHTSRQTE